MTTHFLGGFTAQTRSKRILECFWRFFFYTSAFIYGCKVNIIYSFFCISNNQILQIMVHKSWLWDVKECWIGYPWHTTDDDVWLVITLPSGNDTSCTNGVVIRFIFRWYYMVELTFYYSLLISSIFDVRRSDFWQLIFHHIVTIGLLSLSYAINFVR